MKRRPKKRNPGARKPLSRHEKIECQVCGEKLSSVSLTAHYALEHPTRKLEVVHG